MGFSLCRDALRAPVGGSKPEQRQWVSGYGTADARSASLQLCYRRATSHVQLGCRQKALYKMVVRQKPSSTSTLALDSPAPDSEPAAICRSGRCMTQRYTTLEFLDICSPRVREMYEHWVALRGARILPHRDQLDPARITRYLPGIMLVDVLWGPPLDFIYRLVGTREVESRGADPTGRRVADAYFAANV